MSLVIHHNPECGTSRNVLSIIEAAGIKPVVIEYMKTAWTRPQLLAEVRRLLALPATMPAATARECGSEEHEGLTLRRYCFETEPGILVPGVLAYRAPDDPGRPLAIVVSGRGKADALEPGGPVETLARQGFQVLAVDLRGWGETRPNARLNRELVGLFGEDWQEAMLSILLDRPLLGQRVYDLEAVLQWASQAGVGVGKPIRLHGSGSAGPVALHAAALDERIAELHLDQSLVSWQAVIRACFHRQQLTNVVPGALKHYDFPDLVAAIVPRRVEIRGAVDPAGRPCEGPPGPP